MIRNILYYLGLAILAAGISLIAFYLYFVVNPGAFEITSTASPMPVYNKEFKRGTLLEMPVDVCKVTDRIVKVRRLFIQSNLAVPLADHYCDSTVPVANYIPQVATPGTAYLEFIAEYEEAFPFRKVNLHFRTKDFVITP